MTKQLLRPTGRARKNKATPLNPDDIQYTFLFSVSQNQRSRMAKIVTVYQHNGFDLDDMAGIRWLKMSQALARSGHQVEMAIRGQGAELPAEPNLRRVNLEQADWHAYDVIKTVFHRGFLTLERYHGHTHPFIVSNLGSVVGIRDMHGIYFYGRVRRKLYATQKKIVRASRYVTVLNPEARALWHVTHGGRENVYTVAGAVEREIPPPLRDPYPASTLPRALFSGNIYDRASQAKANRVLTDKLNALGKALMARGIRLYMLGPGDVRRLNPEYVTYLGAVPYDQSWDYLHFCDVGIVVCAGPFQQNNESTKIYYYLRAGKPMVSESGFPNDYVVRRAGMGFVVQNVSEQPRSRNATLRHGYGGDMSDMAEHVERALHEPWNRERAVQYILDHHTWDKRVETYNRLFAAHGL